MTNFLPRMASSDTEAAKAATEPPSQGVLASKGGSTASRLVMACPHKRRTTSTLRHPRHTVRSVNNRQPRHEMVRQARTCRATTVPDRHSLQSINSSILEVLRPATAAYQKRLAVPEAPFPDRITVLGINKQANQVATTIHSVDMSILLRWLEDQARLQGCDLDQQSTICRGRVDFHRRRARVNKVMEDIPAI